ncbi:MAG: hypothetical protein KF897_03440 [Opitutaceae bacterium]|nr:hypothetical protein [Opitutaceae bacterium]
MGHSRRGTRWEFYSPRLEQRLVASSSLEFEHYVLVECDPEVETYSVQVAVEAEVEGESRKTILDSVVRYRDGRVVVNEVKFKDQVESSRTQFAVQRAWASQQGYGYEVLTEDVIRVNVVHLENCHALLPWARPLHAVPEEVRVPVMGQVADQDKDQSIEVLVRKTGFTAGEVVSVIVRAYLAGRVLLPDIKDKKFGQGTLVRRVG